jgi:hypothetical protein
MSDKITLHPLNQILMWGGYVNIALATFFSLNVLAQSTNATNNEWWFDVEVILFERNLDIANIPEKFKQSRLEQPPSYFLDLLTPYLKPDLHYLRAGLPYCRSSNRLSVKTQYAEDFTFPMPVPETNESSAPQENAPLQQIIEIQKIEKDLQIGQHLTATDSQIPADNLHNAQLNADIITQPDVAVISVPTTNNARLPDFEQQNSGDEEQQLDLILSKDSNLVRPAINVEFIEWQVPSELLCAYAEQIAPSFASTVSLEKNLTGTQSTNPIKHVPNIINGIQWQQKRGPFLLPTSTMHMSELYQKIKRQRDITPILHLNWRQEVKFGRDKGQTFRLFAGENFADQFDANGLLLADAPENVSDSLHQTTDEFYIPEQELASLTPQQQQTLLSQMNETDTGAVVEDLLTRIAKALADDTPININQADSAINQTTTVPNTNIIKELWKLDGGITVYLRNIGRVPYLHIDSNLDFRQPISVFNKEQHIKDLSTELTEQGAITVNQLQQPGSPQLDSSQPDNIEPNFLQSVNFNQLRRVISQQVHYFDHPLFGMVVRLNRYRWPEVEDVYIDVDENDKEEEKIDINNAQVE